MTSPLAGVPNPRTNRAPVVWIVPGVSSLAEWLARIGVEETSDEARLATVVALEVRPEEGVWTIHVRVGREPAGEVLGSRLHAWQAAAARVVEGLRALYFEFEVPAGGAVEPVVAGDPADTVALDEETYMQALLARGGADRVREHERPESRSGNKNGNGNGSGNGNGNGNGNGSGDGNDEEILYGRRFSPITVISVHAVEPSEEPVVIRGEVLQSEFRTTRQGVSILQFDLTDGTDSLTVKLIDDPRRPRKGNGNGGRNGSGGSNGNAGRDGNHGHQSELERLRHRLEKGDWVIVRGRAVLDRFLNEVVLEATDIMRTKPAGGREDTAPAQGKRVELHLHTKMSAMDAVCDVEEAVRQAAAWGHPAVAITDHGVVQSFPAAYEAGKKYGIKIIYGLEGYLVESPDENARRHHIIILARDQAGLKDLYELVSLSHLRYFYRYPRLPRAEIAARRRGLVIGSACESGELFQAVLDHLPEEKLVEIASFYDYLEIQPRSNNAFLLREGRVASEEELMELNRRIYQLGKRLGKPVVATGDVHFLRPEDEVLREIILAAKGYADVERQVPLYFRTTPEMLEEFAYLGEDAAREVVVTNPRRIADDIEPIMPVPDRLYAPEIPEAPAEIENVAWQRARELYGDPLPAVVEERLRRELKAIVGNGFASLYWIARKLVQKSLADGYLVGSRGSVGSSLVATMCGITEVNPLPPHYLCPACHYCEFVTTGEVGAGVDLPGQDCPRCGTPLDRLGFDIPFEVFMGFHGEKVPDIDLNFSGEYQPEVHRYAEELFGEGQVYRAGTISTLADKTAFGIVRAWAEEKGKKLRRAEMNRLTAAITGVKRTTGQHPGGLMIVPREVDVHQFTPVQYPANDRESGTVTTHFDYHSISERLVKVDILGHDDPTLLRLLYDLTGVDPRSVPLSDPKVLSLFSSCEVLGVKPEDIGTSVGTLGIPEFNTPFVRQMLEETRPSRFADLVRISGFSHGTNVWTNNAQELIRSGKVTLQQAIGCRDDIMLNLVRWGVEPLSAFKIMEQVRKGKGLKPEDEALMRNHGVPEWYIESCKKISYMFPKAHAVAYVTMEVRIGYYKVYYPAAFYAAYFTVKSEDFDANLVRQGIAAIRKVRAEIASKGSEATAKERDLDTVLEVVQEALLRGIRFLPVDVLRSHPTRFQIVEGALLPPLVSLPGVGSQAAQAIAAARDEAPFSSVEDLRTRARVSRSVVEVLREAGALAGLPEGAQLSLF